MLEVIVVVAALLCGLVAGLLYAFAVVAMPGISTLSDGEFIRSFQVMDRVIQNNHPLFMLAWIGSVVALIAALVLGITQLNGPELALIIAAAAVYLIGVQLPTTTINVPLNNRLQELDTTQAGDRELATERTAFESRWNRWNRIRTALSALTTLLLLVLLAQL